MGIAQIAQMVLIVLIPLFGTTQPQDLQSDEEVADQDMPIVRR
eukprot:CAMPEP_0198116680 /NCGR_PEP_ID=MMETSP1442-20131203/14016_1 /TAXON_ID= /ORGANISM="Craspedostauros australis, Strain CCMP3328" /LENGTH=42 /DNA_ID= /DNA_START= /DNA_END= /DNA_ORIENTATION=